MASERDQGEERPPLGLVVIGHVNHGKTALVRALTGLETDRLKEEVARGMSITLGFAWRVYPAGVVDFIDAPGHEDFIRAMVMGASGARAALLVISAVEGFGRQTHEHLQIAQQLGIGAGVVAVAKSDLLAAGSETALRTKIAMELAGTFLAAAPVVFCSARSGAGIAELHRRLARLAASAPATDAPPGAWLPLDRVFTLAGAGTIATGTLQGAALRTGQEAVLLPSGRAVTLRQLQVHGQGVESAPPGGRVAVGLRGVAVDAAPAGEVLCAPCAFAPALAVDVMLTLSPGAPRPLKSLDEVRVMWGARQDMAKVRPIGVATIAPGETAPAQLRFRTPVVAYAGQRAVLRRPSPAETIGGVVVLDPASPQARGKLDARLPLLAATAAGDLDRIAGALAARDGGVLDLAEAARLSRRGADDVSSRLRDRYTPLDAERLAARASIAEARQAYLDRLAEAHRDAPARLWAAVGPIRGGLGRTLSRDIVARVERDLAAEGAIRLQPARVALAGHDPIAALPPTALVRLDEIEQAFRAAGMTPPGPAEFAEDRPLLDLLVETGRLIALRNVALRQTVVFHAAALADALADLAAAFPPPAAFATGEARAALATSRKFIVPVMELFDERGATVREGDVRRLTGAQIRFDVPQNPF